MNSLVTALQPAMLGLLIKGTLVLFIAAGTSLVLRRGSASARYLVWSTALVILIALPVVPTILPSWNLPVDTSFLEFDLNPGFQNNPRESAAGLPETTPLGISENPGTEPFEASTPPMTPPTPQNAEIAGSVQPTPAPSGAITRLGRANAIALGVWVAGAAAVLARLLFGFLGIWWIARQAKPVVDRRLLELTRDLSDDIGLKTPVRLLLSHRSITPMTWGITWPAVLLPRDATEWSDERRRMILLHELAHVKRRDCLVQFVVWMACSLYWMNPFVWMAVRKMHIERERACEDMVLDSGFQGSDYAEHLLDIAKSLRAAPLSALTTVAMAHRSHFETRLLAILDPRLHRAARGRIASSVFAMTVVSGTVALATMQAGAPEPVETTGLEPISVSVVEPVRATGPLAEALEKALPEPLALALPEPLAEAMPEPLKEALEQGIIRLQPQIEASVRPLLERAILRQIEVREGFEARLQRREASAQLTDEQRQSLQESLRAALQDEEADVRRAAAMALARLGDEVAVDALIGALVDPDPGVRRDAIYGLGDIEDPRSVQPLIGLLGDTDADIRRAAAWALGELEDPQAVGPLTALLQDEDAQVRRDAIQALGEIEDPSALDSIASALNDSSAEVRRHAVWALGEFEDPATLDLLVGAFNDDDAEVRRYAAWALGELEDSRANSRIPGTPYHR